MPEQPKILIIDDYDLNIKLCRAILHKLKAMKGRQYKKEFVQFLSIAEGSLFEMLALCELFRRRKLFKLRPQTARFDQHPP